jgi:3-oxoacyl-[acyl-carrier-protein] synthase-3
LIAARLLGTGSATAGRLVTTRELSLRAFPDVEPAEMELRTGITTRYWLAAETPAAELATAALRCALEAADLPASALRRLILVTSTGGDHLIPATANDVAARLDLDDSCDAFDVNNSCAGFLSGFDLAARSVATGLGPVAVVAVETFSRRLSPEAPRAFMVLGDGSAAVVLGDARGAEEGILASHLRNAAVLRGRMDLPHEMADGIRRPHDFGARNQELKASALSTIRRACDAALEQAHLAWADVDWFLPHQPNGQLFALLVEELGVSKDRVVSVVHEVGSLGSASVPTSLDRLMRTRQVVPGQRILMTSVGAGTAYGAIIYQVGP